MNTNLQERLAAAGWEVTQWNNYYNVEFDNHGPSTNQVIHLNVTGRGTQEDLEKMLALELDEPKLDIMDIIEASSEWRRRPTIKSFTKTHVTFTVDVNVNKHEIKSLLNAIQHQFGTSSKELDFAYGFFGKMRSNPATFKYIEKGLAAAGDQFEVVHLPK